MSIINRIMILFLTIGLTSCVSRLDRDSQKTNLQLKCEANAVTGELVLELQLYNFGKFPVFIRKNNSIDENSILSEEPAVYGHIRSREGYRDISFSNALTHKHRFPVYSFLAPSEPRHARVIDMQVVDQKTTILDREALADIKEDLQANEVARLMIHLCIAAINTEPNDNYLEAKNPDEIVTYNYFTVFIEIENKAQSLTAAVKRVSPGIFALDYYDLAL